MAFRYLLTRTAANSFQIGSNRANSYVTTTTAKMKAYSPTVDYRNHQQQSKGKAFRGDFVPIYVALGMITLSLSLGLHTAKQQLSYSPSVYVRKKRRETVPEVVEPEHVAEEVENLFSKSFFRKVAHVQENDKFGDLSVVHDPIHGDAFAHRHRVETLKSVGVDPGQS